MFDEKQQRKMNAANKKEKDALFKHHFSHQQEVIDFLKTNLPQALTDQIDFRSLRELKKEYRLPQKKTTRNVDVLWEAKLKSGAPLIFLFQLEAQGEHDPTMMPRILVYHGVIGIDYAKDAKKIPTIITFVVYHGKGEWTTARSIADAFEDFTTYVAFSLKRNLIIDLPRTPIKKLKKSKNAFVVQALLSKEAKGDMKSIVGHVIEEVAYKKPACCRGQDINFLFSRNKGEDEEILEELHKFAPEIAQKYSTMLEKTARKYKEIGEKEGILKGKKEGIQQGILKGKKEGMQSAFEIFKKIGISQEALERARKEAEKSKF